MEQKMAAGTGLTPRQKQLLDLAVNEPYFLKTFYLSGGTALSSWYLHHRESLDLDFFSDTPFEYDRIKRWFREKQPEIGYKYSVFDEDYGFLTVNLRYPNGSFLKTDFSHYTQKRLSPGMNWRGLEIDSLYDIAVNKIDTIATRPRTRDYVDFYFIMKQGYWSLNRLINDILNKFPDQVDALKLSKNFLKVSEYRDLPNMLVSFDQKAMEKFFLDQAKSLKKEIFKK